jgi:hypothetical protein
VATIDASTAGPKPGEHRPSPAKTAERFDLRAGFDVAFFFIFAALVIATFLFIHRYAVNMIYNDQWTDIDLLRHVNLGALWAQHNENRILFPNLIVVALAATSHFDVLIEDYLAAAMWCMTVILLILTHKRRSQGLSWILYLPVAVVLLAPVPLIASLWGYLIQWFLALLGLAAALYLLDRPALSPWAVGGAIAMATVGSYSAIEGLFIWPAGLVLLCLRRRSKAPIIAWLVSAIVVWAVYFVDYSFATTEGDNSYILQHPFTALQYFISSFGNVVDTSYGSTSPTGENSHILTLGALVLAVAIWALIRSVHSHPSDGRPIGAALITFGLLFVIFITFGRSHIGLFDATRFANFTLILWVGAYLALIDTGANALQTSRWARRIRLDALVRPAARSTDGHDRVGQSLSVGWTATASVVALVGLIGLFLIAVVLGARGGLSSADTWHAGEDNIVDVAANINGAPDGLVTVLGDLPPTYLRQNAAYARSRHFSLFNTALVAKDARQGLFPSLLTQVLQPTDGARVSGVTVLDAGVTSTAGIVKVQFEVTGNGLDSVPVGTARITVAGWISVWNTITVPNGYYKVQSVLYRSGGRVSASSPIWVAVSNKSAGGTTGNG